jgi:hypothetical protein
VGGGHFGRHFGGFGGILFGFVAHNGSLSVLCMVKFEMVSCVAFVYLCRVIISQK